MATIFHSSKLDNCFVTSSSTTGNGNSNLVGATVRKKDYSIEGTISAELHGKYIIIDSDGFEWEMKRSDFEVIDVEARERDNFMLSLGTTSCIKDKKAVSRNKDIVKNEVVVDLHKYAIGQDARVMMANQVEAFKLNLENYRGKHGVKIVFINGNGVEDRLRNELIKILNRQKRDFEYYDAPSSIYRYHTAIKVVVK